MDIETIKYAIRLASIVIILLIYILIWKFAIDETLPEFITIIFVLLHLLAIVFIILWAWL